MFVPAAQYERKMRALEAERRAIEEEKQKVEGTRSEVDRYKQLLLKQRDIMIALTARLNQRDEQIVGLRVSLARMHLHACKQRSLRMACAAWCS